MKITVTYLPEEAREANLIYHFVRGLLPGVRVHESAAKPPYVHLYLATKKGARKSGDE